MFHVNHSFQNLMITQLLIVPLEYMLVFWWKFEIYNHKYLCGYQPELRLTEWSVSCFLFPAPAYSQRLYASENPLPVGKNVTLFSQAGVSVGAWMFNTTMIVMIFPGNEIISNDWKNRLISNTTTNYSSLTITSMRVEDSGVYTLQDVNLFRAQLTLSVQGKSKSNHFLYLPLSLIFSHSVLNKTIWKIPVSTFVFGQCLYAKQKSTAMLESVLKISIEAILADVVLAVNSGPKPFQCQQSHCIL